MATTIFSNWLLDNIGLLPTPEEGDSPLPQIGVTFFVRAPHLEDDSTTTGWADVASLGELLQSPHWQAPGYFSDDELVVQDVGALADYYVSTIAGQSIVQLPDGFSTILIGATSAIPLVALAFWYDGTLDTVERPLLSLVRLNNPMLLMASMENPVTISSQLLFAWRAGYA